MKLKDVLDQYHGDKNIMIEVRCNSPLDDEDDMLFGWCIITRRLMTQTIIS